MRELMLDEVGQVSGAGPQAVAIQTMCATVGVLGGTAAAACVILPAVASPEILRALVITGLFSMGPPGMLLLPAAVVVGGCMAGGFAGGALGYAVGTIATLGS